jgi:acyl-CoA synthetase (AMP-forming)/AMP-acid ligase II
MGLIGCVFPALDLPSEMTLIGPEVFVARPAVWLQAISRFSAAISPAPNFAYSLCATKVRDEELRGVDLSSWRVALNGAEPVVPAVLRAFAERFRRWGFRPEALTPVYGLSEAALAVTFSALERPFASRRFAREPLAREGLAVPEADGVELASVGRPLPGFALRLVDGQGRAVPEGRVGRLWVSGPSLMEGYLGRPEATAAVLCDGWLDTGDLGFLSEGELYLTGRAKDLVLLRGRGYAPDGIELALAGLRGARAGCAVAASWLPEGAPGEVLGVFVETAREAGSEAAAALPAAVRRAVLSATGLAVDEVVVLPPGTLPRTSSGKLRRGETVRRHLAGELKPPAPVTALSLAGAMARSSLAYARLRLAGRGAGGGEDG